MDLIADYTVIIQARMGSKRLPGKCLRPLGSRTILGHIASRISALACDRVIAAIPDDQSNDPLELEARRYGLRVVRGPEDDVLARFLIAFEKYPSARVVRLTGDNPLVDANLVRATIDVMPPGMDAIVTTRDVPYGYASEAFTAALLRRAAALATDPYDREHVTPWMYRVADRVVLIGDRGLGDLRWTLDTLEDWRYLNQLFSECGDDASFDAAVAWSREHAHPVAR